MRLGSAWCRSRRTVGALVGCPTPGLEELGLVERRGDPDDRRVKNLVVTSKGKALREAMRVRTETDLPATVGLSRDQQATLRDHLRDTLEASDDIHPLPTDAPC